MLGESITSDGVAADFPAPVEAGVSPLAARLFAVSGVTRVFFAANFITVTKEGKPGQFVYGELTTNVPIADELYQFYVVSPLTENSCKLELELYWIAKSPVKRLIISLFAKSVFRKNMRSVVDGLYDFVERV